MRLKSVHQKLFSFCNRKPTFGIIAKVNDLVKGFSACAQLWDQSENRKLIVILSLAIFWYSQSGFPAANQSMSVVADGKLVMPKMIWSMGKRAYRLKLQCHQAGMTMISMSISLMVGKESSSWYSCSCFGWRRKLEDSNDNEDEVSASQVVPNIHDCPNIGYFLDG